MWDNVDIIIRIIESRIDYICHTIDLYDSQLFSKEYEYCSLKSYQFIRESFQITKPLGVGYGFKSNCLSSNELFSKLQDFHQSRRQNQKLIFPPFGK